MDKKEIAGSFPFWMASTIAVCLGGAVLLLFLIAAVVAAGEWIHSTYGEEAITAIVVLGSFVLTVTGLAGLNLHRKA